MRLIFVSGLAAVALAGCGLRPGPEVTVARAAGPPPVKLHWVGQRELDLEGEIENVTNKPLDNLVVEATVDKLETGPDGKPLTWTTTASVVYDRPGAEYRIVSGAGRERTFTSAGGPDISVPPGQRGGFRLQSVDRRMVQRVQVFRQPPGNTAGNRELLAAFDVSELR